MRVATAIAELLDLGEQRTAVPLPSPPTLPQVVAEGLCHAGPRLHPVALRQCVQPQPPIQPPPIDSQMGCDLTDVRPAAFIPRTVSNNSNCCWRRCQAASASC